MRQLRTAALIFATSLIGCSQSADVGGTKDDDNQDVQDAIEDLGPEAEVIARHADGVPMFIIGVPSSFTGDPCVTSFPDEIPGYVSQTYVFRWHEPESAIYRDFAIAPEINMGRSAWVSPEQDTSPIGIVKSIWTSVTGAGDAEEQQKLWRLLMYRELPAPMIEFRFKIFVNEKVLPYYNEVRYGQ